MSTDLYGIRILETKPEVRKITVKVFVVYYDLPTESHQPIPTDPRFFFEILWGQPNTKLGKAGTLGEEVSDEQCRDEIWMGENISRFIKNIALLSTANFPLVDYTSLGEFYYERNGKWADEDKLVQATYEIEVTDKKYFDHLSPDMSWGTPIYDYAATKDMRHYKNALPDSSKIEIRFDSLQMESKWDTVAVIRANFTGVHQELSVMLKQIEAILTPLFTENYTMEEVQDSLLLLFMTQRDSIDLKKWLDYLKVQMASYLLSEKNKGVLEELIFFLKDIFFRYFEELVPHDLNKDNLSIAINNLKGDFSLVKVADEIIDNPSQNPEVREMQKLVALYLNQTRDAVMDFEGVIEWLE